MPPSLTPPASYEPLKQYCKGSTSFIFQLDGHGHGHVTDGWGRARAVTGNGDEEMLFLPAASPKLPVFSSAVPRGQRVSLM